MCVCVQNESEQKIEGERERLAKWNFTKYVPMYKSSNLWSVSQCLDLVGILCAVAQKKKYEEISFLLAKVLASKPFFIASLVETNELK